MILLDDPDRCVQEIIKRVNQRVVVATPLGLGKPIQILNALYRAAKRDQSIELYILTALSLEKPRSNSDLVNRLLAPAVQRIYGDYEELAYEIDRRKEALPHNVKVIEFFLTAGAYLNNATVQRNFIASNYTHVVRDSLVYGINVIAPLIAVNKGNDENFSLSCNADTIKDLCDIEKEAILVGEINENLPYMFGPQVEIKKTRFDFILQNENSRKKLFSIPKQPIADQDFMIGLYVSSLVKDDGCLQLGIGNLGDAIVYSLILRHKHNKKYKDMLKDLGVVNGEDGEFEKGLFASTEMLVDGYLELYKNDILKKIVVDDGGSCVAHAGFFIGSQSFYKLLKDMPEAEIRRFSMRGVSEINQLYGDEIKRREQRKNACFINSSMMVTLLGDVVSDGLDNGATVSGVGGQYNFVAMALELMGGRSVILCRGSREKHGRLSSNIVFNYQSVTIPRHLRDAVVTEYGVAMLRGKTDEEVVKALLNIADSRMQDQLLQEAKAAKKIDKSYEIPEQHRHNFPEEIKLFIHKYRKQGWFLEVPFGSEFTDTEICLFKIFHWLETKTLMQQIFITTKGAFIARNDTTDQLLERLKLKRPSNMREYFYRALIKGAIKYSDGIGLDDKQ